MFGLGIWEVLLIFGLILFFFGGRKIPLLARGLGAGIRNFKASVKEDGTEERLEPGDGDRLTSGDGENGA